mmetsp:Transcript_2200/g.3021  ORF Transcript_2200/g.3021 Transcript_2200/m.3021 type:complete len:217 (-) Transcript_2200:753-1403(-)
MIRPHLDASMAHFKSFFDFPASPTPIFSSRTFRSSASWAKTIFSTSQSCSKLPERKTPRSLEPSVTSPTCCSFIEHPVSFCMFLITAPPLPMIIPTSSRGSNRTTSVGPSFTSFSACSLSIGPPAACCWSIIGCMGMPSMGGTIACIPPAASGMPPIALGSVCIGCMSPPIPMPMFMPLAAGLASGGPACMAGVLPPSGKVGPGGIPEEVMGSALS